MWLFVILSMSVKADIGTDHGAATFCTTARSGKFCILAKTFIGTKCRHFRNAAIISHAESNKFCVLIYKGPDDEVNWGCNPML